MFLYTAFGCAVADKRLGLSKSASYAFTVQFFASASTHPCGVPAHRVGRYSADISAIIGEIAFSAHFCLPL